ncbi:MAG: tetratricopeptide repeat protein [Rhodospirillaceae bacterium]|nr:tetratricopeptide repeat protein [Rhodospirillaceae bacterium]
MAAHQSGRLDEAVAGYTAVLAAEPNHAIVHCNLGLALQARGDFQGAATAFRRAAELQPDLVQAHAGLAGVLDHFGRLDDAIANYQRALAIDPSDVVSINNLGGVMLRAARVDEARRVLESGLLLSPENPSLLLNYGNALRRAGQPDEAIAVYERVLAVQPTMLEARVNLGHVLRECGRWIEAINVYERALFDGLPLPEGYINIAGVLADQDMFGAAVAISEAAVAAGGDTYQYAVKHAFLLLSLGVFKRGWIEFEQRLKTRKWSAEKAIPEPPARWKGESLHGKTILVRAEQGLGDLVLFGGMLPDVVASAGKVMFECRPRLARTFARSFPGVEIVEPGFHLKNPAQLAACDYQIMLASLGQYLRPELRSFPRHVGYLRSDAGRVAALRAKYRGLAGGRAVVGVAWRSQNPKLGSAKSADLAEWGAVLGTALVSPGAWFVNLQYGEVAADLAAARERLGVEVYQDPEIDSGGDLDDFFAQVAACDLVISTSNTTVHVAGSQNVPCWVVLPRGVGSLWYWFLDRSDSPWYPSVKLYRQASALGTPGWWREPVARVGADLAAWLAGRGKKADA